MLSLITSSSKKRTLPIVKKSTTIKSEMIAARTAVSNKQVFHIRLFQKSNQDGIQSKIINNLSAHFANFLDDQHQRIIQSTRQQKSWCERKPCPDLIIYKEQKQTNSCAIPVPVLAVQIIDQTKPSWGSTTESQHYQAISGLQEYILIAKDQFSIKSFYKSMQNIWLLSANIRHLYIPFYINTLSSKQQILALTLDDIYAEVIGQLD